MVFDLLSNEKGTRLLNVPLAKRRPLLEMFSRRFFKRTELLHLSPATLEVEEAKAWLEKRETFLDGIIAKRIDFPYAPGERTAMQKYKGSERQTALSEVFDIPQNRKQKSVLCSLVF